MTAAEPWRQPPISDYGFLSDCASAALVDRHGSIDWWCVPRFDSASVFGRLLDPDAGHWTMHPQQRFTTTREYVEDTLALRTRFVTATGQITVTDALAFAPGARGHDIGLRSPHVLIRRIDGVEGVVEMRSEFAPRMEYGRTQPHLRPTSYGVEAVGGPIHLLCEGPPIWRCEPDRAVASFRMSAGQSIELHLCYYPSFPYPSFPPPQPQVEGPDTDPPNHPASDSDSVSLADTIAGWQSWAAQHTSYDGAFPDEVRRSSIVLQGLTYQPSGAVVAAATTSLPELVGGELNFDYRYAWLRDLSLTIRSLWLAACPAEPSRLLSWFTTAAGRTGAELVQIMYGVEGERDLSEHTLDNLAGYRDSRPVRVGNQAWQQKQLDVLGEVLDAAYTLRGVLGDAPDSDLDPVVAQLLVGLANRAADAWAEPDAGMWEARDRERHYTSSKVMCWVALDRAIALAPRLGAAVASIEVDRWTAARDEVRATIVERAWNEDVGAYTGAFDSDDLDASVLILPLVGFLPATEPRMRATIDVIEDELSTGGLIRRWSSDPYGFLICTYWLVECLALAGEHRRATTVFQRATSYANDLGLLAEQADPESGQQLGNTPQAFSHVGLINAAWRIAHPTP